MNLSEFNQIKYDFVNRHNADFTVSTSPMNADGTYYKEYIFEDGAQWIECMRPVWREVLVKVENVEIKVSVKLLEIEAWNTEDAHSIYYYERFNHEGKAEL